MVVTNFILLQIIRILHGTKDMKLFATALRIYNLLGIKQTAQLSKALNRFAQKYSQFYLTIQIALCPIM